MSKRTTLGITMGDPAGVGPEILAKAIIALREREDAPDVVAIGCRATIEAAMKAQGDTAALPDVSGEGPVRIAEIASSGLDFTPGVTSGPAGQMSFDAIARSVELVKAGVLDGIVTCPVSKEAINMAGIPFVGHTEALAEMTDTKGTVMMLAHGEFRVTHLTTHIPLIEVSRHLTVERLTRVIDLTIDTLTALGIERPRIAVAGLNPHAGENGLFGTEEQNVSNGVIASYKDSVADVSGPHPGDTVFVKALAGIFDAVIAMFHDQGHIPVKMAGFRIDPETGRWVGLSGVNVTLGLPIVRTSVDHGTAFDIAGQGIASAQSLLEAIDYAERLCAPRTETSPTTTPAEA